MEDFTLKAIAVVISFFIILLIMKLLKFIWNKVLWKLILFVKPELKNIYDFLKWIKNLFRKKIDDPANKSEKSETKYSKASMTTLFDELWFSHSLAFTMSKTKNGTDTLFLSVHSFNIVGNIPLSKNWKFIIGSISYDLLAKSLVYPSFGFSRDLHCWNMNFAWHPNTGVYTFFIGVKSGALTFLKYDYQQPYIPRI